MINPPITGNEELDYFLYQIYLGNAEATSASSSVTADTSTSTNTSTDPLVGIPYVQRYIQVKYADDNIGTNISNVPTNRTYWGVYNSDSTTESLNPADYTWYETTGFTTIKFLYYSNLGGRLIKFFAGEVRPAGGTWAIDPGTAIDLDVLRVPVSAINSGDPAVTGTAALLTALTNSITQSQLFEDLGARINLIDADGSVVGSVSYKVAQEAAARATAITAEAATRAAAITAEASARTIAITAEATARVTAVTNEATTRAAAITSEATTRQAAILAETNARLANVAAIDAQITTIQADVATLSGTPDYSNTTTYSADDIVKYNGGLYRATTTTTGNLPTNTSFWEKIGDYASLGEAVAAQAFQIADLDTRVTTTESGLIAEANARTLLASTVSTNNSTLTAAISSESSTRATADAANASSITTVAAIANSKTKSYSQDDAPTTGLVTGDLWFDTNDNNKAYRYSGTAWVATDDTRITTNAAAISTETTARVNGDAAIASQITTINSSLAGNAAAISTEATTRATADTALSTTITTLQSTVGTNLTNTNAAIVSEASTRATADTALSTSITALTSTVDTDRTNAAAAITTEATTRATADTALSTSIATLSSTVTGNDTAVKALITAEATTRANADTAISSTVTALTATVNTDRSNAAAAITTEATTRATADTALSSSITALTSTVTTNDTTARGLIVTEAETRGTADTALASSITTLSSTVNTNLTNTNAAITTEANTRATADTALSSSITTLTSTVAGKNKTFSQPAAPTADLVAGDLWFDTDDNNKAYRYSGTAWVATDDTRIASSAAAIVTEANTRSTADTALTNSITALTSTVTTNDTTVRGLVTTEAETRASADTSITGTINTLSSSVDTRFASTNSNITNEASTRATADTALSNTITTLSSSVDSKDTAVRALITAEAETRSTADTAISSTVTALTSTVAGKNKTFSQDSEPNTGVLNGDLWFDTNDNNKAYRYNGTAWVATDDTRIATNAAAIVTEASTRATADSAITSSVTTLSSTVGANSTAITNEATTRASETGNLFSKYSVKIDTNGYVSGFGLASTANDATPVSEFIIRADKFSIASPSGPGVTPVVPFIVNTTTQTINGQSVPPGVYMDAGFIKNGTIVNAKIGNAEIGTLTIQGNAVTIPTSAYRASSFTVLSNTGQSYLVLSVTFTSTGAPVNIQFSTFFIIGNSSNFNTVTVGNIDVTLGRTQPGGTVSLLSTDVIKPGTVFPPATSTRIPFSFVISDTPAAGTVTYNIRAAASSTQTGPGESTNIGVNLVNTSLLSLETKR